MWEGCREDVGKKRSEWRKIEREEEATIEKKREENVERKEERGGRVNGTGHGEQRQKLISFGRKKTRIGSLSFSRSRD